MKFTETNHCLSGTHCNTCRDRSAGRAWRESIAKAFDVPGVDWDCPHGVPWMDADISAYIKALRKIRLGDKIAAVTKSVGIKPCTACKKRQKLLNGES